VRDLASAITAAKSLIEFKKEFSKPRGKKTQDDTDNDGDKDKYPRLDKPTIFKDKKDETPKKISCFLYHGPHRVFECPKRGKRVALAMKEERQEVELGNR